MIGGEDAIGVLASLGVENYLELVRCDHLSYFSIYESRLSTPPWVERLAHYGWTD
jgi:hypothetical protein